MQKRVRRWQRYWRRLSDPDTRVMVQWTSILFALWGAVLAGGLTPITISVAFVTGLITEQIIEIIEIRLNPWDADVVAKQQYMSRLAPLLIRGLYLRLVPASVLVVSAAWTVQHFAPHVPLLSMTAGFVAYVSLYTTGRLWKLIVKIPRILTVRNAQKSRQRA